MSRLKKEIDRRVKTAQHRIAERNRMEQFCINDHRGKSNCVEDYEELVKRIQAMSMAELVKEYNRRDGDFVREHGCHPEQMEEHG